MRITDAPDGRWEVRFTGTLAGQYQSVLTGDGSGLTSITYVDGYVLTYNYSSGLNDSISRLSSLSDTSGTLESYDYLGSGTVVRRAHPQPNVDLSYVKRSGESSGDAGDQYTGLDIFGRVVDQRWLNPTSGTATDRFQYAYDLVSNRTSRDNLVNTAFGELYAYDDLSQLVSFQRGTLNGTKTGLTGSASRSQSWDTDAVGNFDSVTTDGTAQSRTANKQNEITSISGATTPTYDDNGNMTGDETGQQFVYDAWNRLVIVKNSVGTTLETFKYDGLNRRVSSDDGTTTTDLYYSSDWQVLSEKVGSNTTKRYVWSPVYVDAMVLRDRDTDGNGTLDERLWVQQDANWNVTALVNGSGAVVERYAYDPYGAVTVYSPTNATVRSVSNYGWQYEFQGLRRDEVTGLYHGRNREYDTDLDRWMQLDPIGFGGNDQDLYRAFGNNALTAIDPSGTKISILFDATSTGEKTKLIKKEIDAKLGYNDGMSPAKFRRLGYGFKVTVKTTACAGIGAIKIKQEIWHFDLSGEGKFNNKLSYTGKMLLHNKGVYGIGDDTRTLNTELQREHWLKQYKEADLTKLAMAQDADGDGNKVDNIDYFKDNPFAEMSKDTLVYVDTPGFTGINEAQQAPLAKAGTFSWQLYVFRVTAEDTDGKKVATFKFSYKAEASAGGEWSIVSSENNLKK